MALVRNSAVFRAVDVSRSVKRSPFGSLGPRARAPFWALKTAVGGARARARTQRHKNGDLTESVRLMCYVLVCAFDGVCAQHVVAKCNELLRHV